MDRRRKKDRRRRREQKVKSRVRAAQLAQAEGIGEDGGPETLFSLARVKGSGAKRLGDAAAPDFEAEGLSSSSEGGGLAASSDGSMDSEEEQRRWVWGQAWLLERGPGLCDCS